MSNNHYVQLVINKFNVSAAQASLIFIYVHIPYLSASPSQ